MSDEQEIIELMAEELAAKGSVETVWTAKSAFQMVAIVQLALRHPRFAEPSDLRQTAERFLDHMRTYFADCPMLSDVIKRGDDPREDVVTAQVTE